MLDPAIEVFFEKRQADWLKKNTPADCDEQTLAELRQECAKKFSLNEWLPDASRRAGQISISTHPCTFSHPSARKNKNGYVTSVIAQSKPSPDGYVRSGNVEADADALGNAAAMDVYKFLNLEMADTQKLLTHIKDATELSHKLLDIQAMPYVELREGFLMMVNDVTENVTSAKIKQVFFPVNGDYHQLSLLTHSGIVFQLRKRIDSKRFSEEVKELRKSRKDHVFAETGYSEVIGLTTIGYGGTKPQNISVMNSSNGGRAYLLSGQPPSLRQQKTRFPKRNFFQECLPFYECRNLFNDLHKVLKIDYNNVHIRDGRDYRLRLIFDYLIEKMWMIRSVAGQFQEDHSSLPKYQVIWLSEQHANERNESEQWLNLLSEELTRWIIKTYEKIIGKQAIKMGESERLMVLAIIENNEEALR